MKLLMVAVLGLALAGCGGGNNPTSVSDVLNGYFVDAPVKGLCYAASPSRLAGTTAADGGYQFKKDDTVSFAIPNEGSCTGPGAVTLGSIVAVDSLGTARNLTHVLSLPNGRRIAEVLNALNLGSSTAMDITNLSIPSGQINRLVSYINSGALPAGMSDNGTLLKSVQEGTTHPIGTVFTMPVNPASFNADVSAHLNVTLNGIASSSTINASDMVGRLFFQADSGGTNASLGMFKSAIQATLV